MATKTTQIIVRVTTFERALLKQDAADVGLTLSDYVRHHVLKQPKSELASEGQSENGVVTELDAITNPGPPSPQLPIPPRLCRICERKGQPLCGLCKRAFRGGG